MARLAAVLWLAAVHTAARADFVTYTFTGNDSLTRSPVTGSFSYNTSAPHTLLLPPLGQPQVALYPDVQGSLSVTDNGHTYTSTSITANLGPDQLILFSNPPETGAWLYLNLPWTGPGLSSITSLPATIDVNRLLFPRFSIGGGNAAPAIGDGPITSVVLKTSAATAPEPGALTLAAIAATGALAVVRRGRRGL
jgi:hypothetical protein